MSTTAEVRHHSADDMPGELMEPCAVVIRPDGSVDVYGYVGIVDQREITPEAQWQAEQDAATVSYKDDERHQYTPEPDTALPTLERSQCSCGWQTSGWVKKWLAALYWEQHRTQATKTHETAG